MKRYSILAVALGMAVAAPQAGAQHFTPSQQSVSYAALSAYVSIAVITAPIWLTAAGFKESGKGSERRSAAKDKGAGTAGAKAGPLPPLTVEKVERQADGAYQVALKNPQSPDDLAVVQWPARDENPAQALKVGDVLDFTPTEAGAGWMVADAQGTALAFLPTTDAAASNLSERW
jgi:hypothetical protein